MPLLDNPVTVIESHPDVGGVGVAGHMGASEVCSALRMSMSDFEMAGMLSKRVHTNTRGSLGGPPRDSTNCLRAAWCLLLGVRRLPRRGPCRVAQA